MNIQEINEKRKTLRLTYKDISEKSGVPISTVQKIFGGSTKSPKVSTLEAVAKVISDEERKRGAAIKKTSMTIEDYYQRSTDIRTELIDGEFYDMSSPSFAHQTICFTLCSTFNDYINNNKGNCISIMSPFDVQIKNDDTNMVQPDVMIICDKDKINDQKIQGAPDLIVEVVSPSSVAHDRIRKLNLYLDSGVREYWLVDPVNDEILVYRFEESVVPVRYSFKDNVPVGIYRNKCKVDFKAIMKLINKWSKTEE